MSDSPSTNGNQDKHGPTHTVLVVEDTQELAEVIQATLESMNLKVLCTAHGSKAIELYHQEKPDLILLDIALPDMTGWKALDTIKEEHKGGALPPIIVITAYGDPANRLMGKLQEAYEYLIKPLTPQEIKRVVRKALDLQ
jgi:CheY-like chemotaxis protein